MKVLTTYEGGVHALIKMKLHFHPLNRDTSVHMAGMLLFYITNNLNKSCIFFDYLLMYIISGPHYWQMAQIPLMCKIVLFYHTDMQSIALTEVNDEGVSV